MFEDLEAIRTAAQMLAVRHEVLPQQLLDAATELWSDMYDCSQWPAELQRHAGELAAQLKSRGDFEAMDAAALNEAANRILVFAKEVEAASRAVC